jgi:CheY-like chemotaxis protein
MAVSGKEAILVYEEWHPDIIVLDIYLPEMTGYQVLKAIRTTIEDNKTTIVMATALSGREDVLSCMKLGVEGYIVKPFQCMEIGAKILSYYAKKEPERNIGTPYWFSKITGKVSPYFAPYFAIFRTGKPE